MVGAFPSSISCPQQRFSRYHARAYGKGTESFEQLAGFREFLLRVEQDRLERMNTPEEKLRMLNRFLPYAIAMGVKEGWGDPSQQNFPMLLWRDEEQRFET